MSKIGLSGRRFTTISGVEVEPFYEARPEGELPPPGEFPYIRGIHRDMYRGRLWTMRQFSGFATPEETNRRYHYLLEQGQTGLSVAFDLPTLMGYDADDAMSEGEVGKCGAPVSSLEDMEILLRGLPLDKISISMTINSPAPILWAMYLAVAEQQGVEWSKLSGTLQNDILKEYIAQKLSFFFNAHNDFFEEIAKYRAARKLWAHLMRDRFGAKAERSLKLRFHAQTAGCSLTWQQPQNNIVRTTLQAMAAVLGGAQSLHTNSLDEAYALPSEHAVTIALRTQQVIAYESGVAAEGDPLGGSYFLEHLTCASEEAARDYIRRIDEMGGMIAAIEKNFPQREIAEASYRYQREVETGDKIIVGVNAFQSNDEEPIEILQIDQTAHERQVSKLAALRKRRNG